MTDSIDNDTTTGVTPPARRRLGGLGVRAATALTAAGLIGGGAVGGFLIANAASPAATPTPSSSGTAPAAGTAPTFHSNEDATHEKGESAQREAQENSGQAPFQQPGAGAAYGTGWTG